MLAIKWKGMQSNKIGRLNTLLKSSHQRLAQKVVTMMTDTFTHT